MGAAISPRFSLYCAWGFVTPKPLKKEGPAKTSDCGRVSDPRHLKKEAGYRVTGLAMPDLRNLIKSFNRFIFFGVIFGAAASLGNLGGMGFPGVREARAAAGYELSFKETLGTAGAVGLVLGASTLPFYGQPGSHLVNLGYGAALGLLAGVGIWMIQDQGSDQARLNPSVPVLPCNPQSVCVPVVSLTW